MKKLFVLLFLLSCLTVSSQITGTVGILTNPFQSPISLPNGSNGQFLKTNGTQVLWGTVIGVDTIYRTEGKDSIQFLINGRYHAIKDSAGGGSLRAVDTIYRTLGKDSIIFTINNKRYAIKDSTNTGTVTSIATGFGITGGTITTSGTLKSDTSKMATQTALADTAKNIRSSTHTDSAILVKKGLLKTISGTKITLAPDTSFLATQTGLTDSTSKKIPFGDSIKTGTLNKRYSSLFGLQDSLTFYVQKKDSNLIHFAGGYLTPYKLSFDTNNGQNYLTSIKFMQSYVAQHSGLTAPDTIGGASHIGTASQIPTNFSAIIKGGNRITSILSLGTISNQSLEFLTNNTFSGEIDVSNNSLALGQGTNVNGTQNTILGINALGGSNSSSLGDVAIGQSSGFSASSAQYDNLIGYDDAYHLSTGSYNNITGYFSALNITSGNDNVISGDSALWQITSQSYNTALGKGAGRGNKSLSRQFYLGDSLPGFSPIAYKFGGTAPLETYYSGNFQPGTSGQSLISKGSSASPQWVGVNTSQSVTASPSGTTSTTPVMLGLGATITPAGSGTIMITIDGNAANSVATDGGTIQIAYGTGSAPINGASPTGTTIGSLLSYGALAAKTPFSTTYIVTSLTLGTAYWVDVQFEAVTGGTFTLTSVAVSINEIK